MSARVLIVDDSPVVRALLRAQLAEHAYDVVEAADGEQALVMALQAAPAIVLLDVEMPGLDGYGVLEAMRADPLLSTIPVVFLTGRASSEDVAEGLRRGAHDYLRKPFEPAELLARVSAAVRTKRLQDELRERNRQLEHLSSTDMLTGLYNRRHLDTQLERLISRSLRHVLPLTVILLDIDRFKAVNDTYGHDAGDAVLVEVGHRLAGRLRSEDVLGRWGGEEFLIVLPDIDSTGALTLADDLRREVADGPVLTPAGPVAVTASFGVAAWDGESRDRLVARADTALYEAKHSGRNTVRTAV